jgi:membrane-associated phospholipid phosphatase
VLGLVYDAMRFVKDVGVSTERVHLCDLRAIDMRIASANVGGARGTVHDWLQAHDSLPLDLLFAIPYGTFLFVAFAFAIYLYVKDYERMRVFGWVFLLVNLAGFATYHLYPAAPPWYFHAHGCSVDLAAHASEGPKLARVDAFLGMHYFRDFYGRASDVYGAVPSLHVAYPLLIMLFGWPVLRLPGRVLAVAFLLLMCTAAVYLDHHWIVDVLAGLAITVAVFVAARALLGATNSTRSRTRTRAAEAS